MSVSCPFYKKCKEKVDYTFFKNYCCSSFKCTWCNRYEEFTKALNTAEEWEEYIK